MLAKQIHLLKLSVVSPVLPNNLCNCRKGKFLIICLEQNGLVLDWKAFATKSEIEFQKLLNCKFPSNAQCGCLNTA